MEVLEFTILGKPMAKQSVKAGTDSKGNRIFYKDSKIVKREKEIIESLNNTLKKDHIIWEGKPIFVTITYVYEYPKAMSKKLINASLSGKTIFKTTAPDVGDNLNKLILDVLEKIVYSLDSEIVNINATKVYGTSNRTEVSLRFQPNELLFYPISK